MDAAQFHPTPTNRPGRTRLAVSIGAVLAVLAGYFVYTLLPASAATSLLSQGKPATASSAENAGTAGRRRGRRQHRHPLVERASAIHSGSRSTSAPPATISQVVLNWEAAYATAFQIQTSANGTTWTTIYSTTTGTGGMQTLTVTGIRPVRADVRHRPGHRLRLLAVGVPGLRRHRRRPPRCGTANAALGQPGDRLVDRERRHPGRHRGRRQHRHPLVQRVQRPAVAPGRPRRLAAHLPGGAELGGRVRARRSRSRCPTTRPPGRPSTRTTTGTGGVQTLNVSRHRPLRADERHRPGHRVRLLAVGVHRPHWIGHRPTTDVADRRRRPARSCPAAARSART